MTSSSPYDMPAEPRRRPPPGHPAERPTLRRMRRRRRRSVLLLAMLLAAGSGAVGITRLNAPGPGGTSLAAEPSLARGAAEADVPAAPPTGYPTAGPGTFAVAQGRSPVRGHDGPLSRYRVEVEHGTGQDADGFAATVDAVLGDPRSWIASGELRVQRVPEAAAADFTVYLATPVTSERMCAEGGLRTDRYTSCRLPGRVVLNLARWMTAVPDYGAPLEVYRTVRDQPRGRARVRRAAPGLPGARRARPGDAAADVRAGRLPAERLAVRRRGRRYSGEPTDGGLSYSRSRSSGRVSLIMADPRPGERQWRGHTADPGESTVSLPPLVEPAAELTVDEIRRYSRHLIIPDVGVEGQKRLKNARVLCVGAGGLGSPALLYLAAAGVGTLGIIDFDTVDESNLQRQVIHGVSDVGRSKAESAAASIREINPLVNVEIHNTALDRENVRDIFSRYDLIVDGTDNFATRYMVNDAAVLLGKPYVWGSIYRFDGQASVFWAEHGPCYRCLYPEPPPPGMVPSCAEGGVLGVLCASIGSIQVNEAIKLLAGIGEPLVGRLMVYDALEMSYRKIKVRKDPNCVLCGENPTLTDLMEDYEDFCGAVSDEAQEAVVDSTITALELKDWQDSGKDIFLVDVREPAEYEIVRIPGSTLIPKGEILSGEALAKFPQDRQIVLHCKSGVRSAEALAALKAAGFNDAVHVQGGVLSWVKQIDPSLPSY